MPETNAPAPAEAPATTMPDQALAERERVLDIQHAARTMRLERQGEELIRRGIGRQEACDALLRLAWEREQALEAVGASGAPMVRGGHDGADPEFRTRQCEDALSHRLSNGRIALPDSATPVRGMSLNQMVEYAGGQRSGGWMGTFGQRSDLGGAHTTSDFPILLLASGQRVLAEAFTVAASPLRQVARVIQVADFRDITRARRGEAEKLLEIHEHGEVVSSSVPEEHETYRVKSYARNFALTRNAIVNDDLNAFGDFLADMGRSAAVTEAGVLVGLITGNGVVLADGTALWHGNHGNLATVGAAPGLEGLTAARSALRLQMSPTNLEPLNLRPRYILVPAALETTAEQAISTVQGATTQATTNVFAGALEVLVEPRLDAVSDQIWYVIADPASMPFIEIATLDGSRRMASAGTPMLDTFEGEDVLGIKFRAVHDFGALPINFRAAFKHIGV